MAGLFSDAKRKELLLRMNDEKVPFRRYRFKTDKNGDLIELGSGAFGVVYEAKHVTLPGDYAMKVLGLLDQIDDPEDLEGYKDEIMLQTKLSHRCDNVVQIFEADSVGIEMDENDDSILSITLRDDIPEDADLDGYIFLQIVLMEKLDSIIEKRHNTITNDKLVSLRELEVLRLGRDISKALVAAHTFEEEKLVGIAHRDIKLENIFYDAGKDKYKLGDFGIARLTENGHASSKAGTDGYIAPEVGMRGGYDARKADIYSFGIMLYVLMNEIRYPGARNYRRPNREVQYNPDAVLPKPSRASEEFSKIILKACSYEPKDRYDSIVTMADDIKFLYEKELNDAKNLMDSIENDFQSVDSSIEINPDDTYDYVLSGSMTNGKPDVVVPELKNPDVDLVMKVANDLGMQIRELHKKGYVHLEIGLESLLYSESTKHYLLDLSSVTNDTQNGFVSLKTGKVGQRAPETELRGEEYDGRKADVYSLGMLLYVLLNDFCYPASDSYRVNRRIQYNPNTKLSAPKNAPDKLSEIILKAIDFNPENRYDSVKDLLTDLSSLGKKEEPVEENIGSFVEEATKDEPLVSLKEEHIKIDDEDDELTIVLWSGNEEEFTCDTKILDDIYFSESNTSLSVGDTQRIKYSYTPSDVEFKYNLVKYLMENHVIEVETVDLDRKEIIIRAVRAGRIILTLRSADYSAKAQCEVVVTEEKITTENPIVSIREELPEIDEDDDIIVTISGDEEEEDSDTLPVTELIKESKLVDLHFSQASASVKEGEVKSISFSYMPSDAINAFFTVSSSNESVATAKLYGKEVLIQAVKPGRATVTLKSMDGSVETKCKVTVPEQKVTETTEEKKEEKKKVEKRKPSISAIPLYLSIGIFAVFFTIFLCNAKSIQMPHVYGGFQFVAAALLIVTGLLLNICVSSRYGLKAHHGRIIWNWDGFGFGEILLKSENFYSKEKDFELWNFYARSIRDKRKIERKMITAQIFMILCVMLTIAVSVLAMVNHGANWIFIMMIVISILSAISLNPILPVIVGLSVLFAGTIGKVIPVSDSASKVMWLFFALSFHAGFFTYTLGSFQGGDGMGIFFSFIYAGISIIVFIAGIVLAILNKAPSVHLPEVLSSLKLLWTGIFSIVLCLINLACETALMDYGQS